MSLDRTQIREDVVARLTGKTAAGTRVFNWRTEPFFDHELPAISVQTPSFRGVKRATGGEPSFKSNLVIKIEIHVAGIDSKVIAAALDSLNQQVEAATLQDPVFVEQFESIDNYDAETGQESNSDKLRGVTVVQFDVAYHRAFPPICDDVLTDLHVDLDAINPSDHNIKTPGPDGILEGGFDITLPQ